MKTSADEQNNDRRRISGTPYFLVVGVDDGKDEGRERQGGQETKSELFESDQTERGKRNESQPLSRLEYAIGMKTHRCILIAVVSS